MMLDPSYRVTWHTSESPLNLTCVHVHCDAGLCSAATAPGERFEPDFPEDADADLADELIIGFEEGVAELNTRSFL